MTVINEKFVINTQGFTDIIEHYEEYPKLRIQTFASKRICIGLCGRKYCQYLKY